MPSDHKPTIRAKPTLCERLCRALDARRGLPAAILALAVLLASLAVIVRAVGFSSTPPFNADLLALLPAQLSQDLPAELEAPLRRRLSGSEAQRLVVLADFSLSPNDAASHQRSSREALETAAVRGVERFEAALTADGSAAPSAAETGLTPASLKLPEAAGTLIAAQDRTSLKRWAQDPQTAQAAALACLVSARPKLLGYAADPFCLFDRWVDEQLAASPAAEKRLAGKTFRVVKSVPDDERRITVLLEYRVAPQAAASGDGRLAAALDRAQKALDAELPKNVAADIIAAGVPRIADAVAARAKADLTMIGTISAVAAALFAVFFFGRPATVIVMAASVAAGFAAALAASLWIFGSLSLVTFVFGATLIGVALDYSTHWFTMKKPGVSVWDRRRALLGPLLTAALSSAAAYAVLALTPLPGLKQMAAIAALGVIATLFFVLALLPMLERFAPKRETRLLLWLEQTLPRWPRLDRAALQRPAAVLCLTAAVGWTILGWLRLDWAPGVEDLNAAPRALLEAQAAERLALPSPAQAFFITGTSLDEALQKEEVLMSEIERIKNAEGFSSLKAAGLSQWLPSLARQQASRADYEKALALAAPKIQSLLGAAPTGPGEAGWTTLAELKKTPLKDAVQSFVLEDSPDRGALVVMLSGLRPEMIPSMHRAAEGIPGASFVDITQGMRDTLSTYRDRVLEFLAAGVLLLFAVLTVRFKKNAWRATAPSVAGILAAFALLGWLGIPTTLFTALAAVLLLGLGIDYGVFLTGSPNDGRTGAAVFFCGITTMLAFGLLVFSSTPALSSFGLVVLSGELVIWLLTPLLRPEADA